nr:hypothetical protein [Limimaricola cinnabarinus]
MGADDGAGDRQPKPCPAGVLAAAVLAAHEGLEHAFEPRLGDARPVIMNAHDRLPAIAREHHPRRPAITDRVVDEVAEGARQGHGPPSHHGRRTALEAGTALLAEPLQQRAEIDFGGGLGVVATLGEGHEPLSHHRHLVERADHRHALVLVEHLGTDAQTGDRRPQVVPDGGESAQALGLESCDPGLHIVERRRRRTHFARSGLGDTQAAITAPSGARGYGQRAQGPGQLPHEPQAHGQHRDQRQAQHQQEHLLLHAVRRSQTRRDDVEPTAAAVGSQRDGDDDTRRATPHGRVMSLPARRLWALASALVHGDMHPAPVQGRHEARLKRRRTLRTRSSRSEHQRHRRDIDPRQTGRGPPRQNLSRARVQCLHRGHQGHDPLDLPRGSSLAVETCAFEGQQAQRHEIGRDQRRREQQRESRGEALRQQSRDCVHCAASTSAARR